LWAFLEIQKSLEAFGSERMLLLGIKGLAPNLEKIMLKSLGGAQPWRD